MASDPILDLFITQNPLTVLTRCIVDSVLDDRVDEVFEDHRQRQYDHRAKYSVIAKSMAEIALGTLKNRNQAHRRYQEQLRVSKTAYYNKLNRTEPGISEAVVRHSAQRADALLGALDQPLAVVLPGYHCVALDGNHLQKTEKRLQETRGLCAAALPGTVVARDNYQSGLLDRAWVLEDAHAQECSVLGQVLADLQANTVVIADRHFCIVAFLLDVAEKCACFVIRHHGRLKGEFVGKRHKKGKTSTGRVFEQVMKITQGTRTLKLRRITIELDEPTRNEDTEVHLLSNLPVQDASAKTLADLYRRRWEIENAFHVLTMTLCCEMASNGYPRCALFQFCMAMVAYNCRQVLLAALKAEHDPEDVAQMSQYQIALDTVEPMIGMLTAVPQQQWRKLIPDQPQQLAPILRHVSAGVDVKSYRKTTRGPKKKKIPRQRYKGSPHVSVHKLLRERKKTR